jgi:shikimate kinase/shikimate kinase/3-dehydroquinate synthase
VKKNLVLVGMMASGKTTIGKLVAKIKDLEFVDTDKSIEKKNSMTIYEIFKKKGEKFFREEEKKEVLKNLEKKNCIIAVGGGSFVNKSIRENILKNAISFWLDVDIKTLNKRVKWNKNRPLLNKKNNMKKLNNLYAERKKIYELADHKIECEQLTKENIVKKIILLYEKY